MTADLIEFLRARLDEVAERALAAPAGPWAEDASHSVVDATGARIIYSVNGGTLHPTPAVRAQILGHDPERVLREVEAKRRIVEQWATHEALDRETFESEGEHARSLVSLRAAYWDASRELAAVYSDHPDYREEWTP